MRRDGCACAFSEPRERRRPVTDWLGTTQIVPPNHYCPGCPDAESADERAAAVYCRDHAPAPVGSEDAVVSLQAVNAWQEASGRDGAAMQSLIGVARETRAPVARQDGLASAVTIPVTNGALGESWAVPADDTDRVKA